MRGTFAAGFVLLLAVALTMLALLPPGKAVTGPPEGVSGKMAFDRVPDGLRMYRKEKDEGKRAMWLIRLAPTSDPRVALALGEALDDPSLGVVSSILLRSYYVPFDAARDNRARPIEEWWKDNKADLRRRAKQLPR
jgi:hypothetical protein